MSRTTLLFLALTLLATAAGAYAADVTPPADKMAILQPVYLRSQGLSSPIASQQNVADVAITITPMHDWTADAAYADPDETAKNVMAKLAKEAGPDLKWPITLIDYATVKSAEDTMVTTSDNGARIPKFKQLPDLAAKLGARYLVIYVVQDLKGWKKFQPHIALCNIDLLIYDANTKDYVWSGHVDEQGMATGFGSSPARIVQSMFNALRKGLEPFVLKGERKQVAHSQPDGLLVTVKQVVSDGKIAVLELGAATGIKIGDKFVSLDGKSHLTISAVMQNGSTADVTDGTCAAGDVFKSAAE